MNQRLVSLLTFIVFSATFAFALDRYLAFQGADSALLEKRDQLSEAQRFYKAHPEAFSKASATGVVSLKSFIQEASSKHGISLAYLTESEKEAGDGVREKDVLWRSVNVSQAKLVSFLAEIEERTGARLKEIRLKPSADRNGYFQEAESTLAMRWVADKTKTKEPQ